MKTLLSLAALVLALSASARATEMVNVKGVKGNGTVTAYTKGRACTLVSDLAETLGCGVQGATLADSVKVGARVHWTMQSGRAVIDAYNGMAAADTTDPADTAKLFNYDDAARTGIMTLNDGVNAAFTIDPEVNYNPKTPPIGRMHFITRSVTQGRRTSTVYVVDGPQNGPTPTRIPTGTVQSWDSVKHTGMLLQDGQTAAVAFNLWPAYNVTPKAGDRLRWAKVTQWNTTPLFAAPFGSPKK